MQIINQLNDTDFVIRVEPSKTKGTHIVVAHDYVNFFGTTSIATGDSYNKSLMGPNAYCSNRIWIPTNLQIPIRSFVNCVLPVLNEHKYCQKEHAKNYSLYGHHVTFYREDGVKMITVCEKGEEPQTMTYSLYEKLASKS